MGPYPGKDKSTKYGLRKTIITGSGVFTGNTTQNNYRTDLTGEFITDYNRYDDWVVTLINQYNVAVSSTNPTEIELNKLFSLPGPVKFTYRDSNYNNYLQRHIVQKKKERAIKKAAQEKKTIDLKKISKTIEEKTAILNPVTRYSGKFLKYSYYNDNQGAFIPILILTNVENELGEPIPSSPNELVGYIMFCKNDATPAHEIYIDKYRAWAIKNNIKLPEMKNRKLTELKNKQQLAEKFNLSIPELDLLIKVLKVESSYIDENLEYYDSAVVEKIKKKLILK